MMRENWTMKACASALLALIVSGCIPGNFCDVQRAPFQFSTETGRIMVQHDRPEAERISAQNEYWRNNCR